MLGKTIKTIAEALTGRRKAKRREVSSTANMWRRQGLTAAVIRACEKCDAPGQFLSDERVKAGWPGCYVETTDDRIEKPVGPICPNCGERRPENRELGEIWKREFR